ncbi:MAG: cation-translocating P-type ATPase [candidate division KSB1 bacterium]|nr:cation-translocating P-type ATPase [candidate division KSB1 bacterium]MDZ7273567.1 cation-translocating P-type ATPase [candidate division KSB1 bacterium]MDZ7286842.1 cation-translocating P-type ATPase [candidate division KSB1 bacterium]MDZ7299801.1 cation-translocating P-type ATPase [candidate division KSB1 bacterium]MDZ7308648.1 cation-translocating P-type ATPase [candidate division KSB1 bacterium]
MDKATDTLTHEEITVAGVHCAGCARTIESAVTQMPGVDSVAVNFANGRVKVSFDKSRQNLARIKERIESAGFQVKHEHRRVQHEARAPFWQTPEVAAVALSGVLLGIGLLVDFFARAAFLDIFGLTFHVATPVLLLALLAGAWHFAPKGLRAVRLLALDINFLMTLAIAGAILIGEYVEAASLAFLYSLAELLEGYAVERARRSLRYLTQIAPAQAAVMREGREQTVDVHEVRVGETIIARPGERIALDGVVVAGASSVNQSPITGESMPLDKRPGDEVYAGSLNEQGYLEIRITRPAQDTTLSRIIEMVEEAENQKAPSAKFIDRFARVYTPAVVLLAVGIAIVPPLFFHGDFKLWFEKALTLLVISCPCALVISTPVAVISAITGAARNGVLIKGGIHLENMAQVRVMAFDKTGTLTSGRLVVTDVLPRNGLSRAELLQLAASLEQRSEHPIAQAILQAAAGLPRHLVSEFKNTAGRGLQGRINGAQYRIGAAEMFAGEPDALTLAQLQELHAQGKSTMLIGSDYEIAGIIAVADRLRENAGAVVAEIHRLGLETIMLSGDNALTARAIARAAGLAESRAELLPEAKVDEIRKLQAQFGKVAMVGDGINDAPALATAEVGIAMGAAGSDAALETADIALMGDDLGRLPYLITLSRRARRIIKQNVWTSLVLKLALGLAVFPGWTTLVIAVLCGDMGATLAVIGNAMRLAGFKPADFH